jgi:predicted ATPase
MMAAEPEPRPAITKVWAKNFRSIEYAELELDPLTVLVGPNASGKSNLLDILGFLSDAARDGLESAINRRGGIDSIGRRTANGRVLGPEVGFRWTTDRDPLNTASPS